MLNNTVVFIVTTALSVGITIAFGINFRHTLRCRSIALEAIRDYNIDQYILKGRDNWKRLKYENVLQSYSHTWFALKKDAAAAIKPQYLERLDSYFKYASKFHEDEKPNHYEELEDE